MTIRFPKVHIDNKQLVYVSFSIEGKRIRSSGVKRRRYAYGLAIAFLLITSITP